MVYWSYSPLHYPVVFHAYMISATVTAAIMIITIARSHVCAMIHIHVCLWVIQNTTVCWLVAPEGDQCLHSAFSSI